MRHVYKCPMRWSDLDFMQHVNNVVYVDYLQEARVDMLRVHSELSDPDRSGEDLTDGLVVVNHAIDYLRPLLLPRPSPCTSRAGSARSDGPVSPWPTN